VTGYDPKARHDTPLARKLKDDIKRHGPIGVPAYMRACLMDSDHGYYRASEAIGQGGDFITAPEISQVFGELIGLWSVIVWKQMGAPAPFNLIEIGPGRGTLMSDALRAAGVAGDFLSAADICMVEINSTLRRVQEYTLQKATDGCVTLRWFDCIEGLQQADGKHKPVILIANEFLDTLPPTQFVRCGSKWHWRQIGLDQNDGLQFRPSVEPIAPEFPELNEVLEAVFPGADVDTVVSRTSFNGLTDGILGWDNVAALMIDYGDTSSMRGDGLQAVRNHTYEHPLTSPGEADLSALVDFHELVKCIQRTAKDRLAIDGPVIQAEFLGSLGMMERASHLMARNPEKAAQIEAGVARLMSPQGMGTRFKAIGVRSKELPILPGFA